MQTADAILAAIRKMGEKRIPLTRVYRCLFSEDLFLMAYDKIRRNRGALTPGTEDDTADGMSRERIRKVIELLRQEKYRFHAARRINVPKASGGTRPLSIPNFTDRLVQEAVRLILEAYYEPRFRESSHGFRPGRGCHTALDTIRREFTGTVWFIEGDIRGCFDNIDHQVLMSILDRDVPDGRLLNLIRLSLEAGYMEDWKYNQTYSGAPQGGVLSPLLANIYLNELDEFVETELIQQYMRGKRRASNLEYDRLCYEVQVARNKGDVQLVRELEQRRRKLPSQDTQDPNYRRLRYLRYADDFLLAFVGPKAEAEAIKAALAAFLREKLHLEMSESKTLITHARTEHATFLGYAISVYHSDDRLTLRKGTSTKTRSANGRVRLGIPFGRIDKLAQAYLKRGKPIHRAELLPYSDAQIIATFQARYRGVAEYYKYAMDRVRLAKLKQIMEVSLTKTLADKFRTTVPDIYRRYGGRRTIGGHMYRTIQVEVPTRTGTTCVYWGAISLKYVRKGTESIDDDLWKYQRGPSNRSDLLQRLKADQCEVCGAPTQCEVHHIRKLADLKNRWKGRTVKPLWVTRMIALQRKTLVVCPKCHEDIHRTAAPSSIK